MYERISTARELRTDYEILGIYKELQKAHPSDHVAQVIKKVKRAIREYRDRNSQNEIRLVRDNGIDGAVLLVQLPDGIQDKETAREFFEKHYYIRCRPSQYDCTGQAFTCWYKIFKRRGRFMAYHSIGFDN